MTTPVDVLPLLRWLASKAPSARPAHVLVACREYPDLGPWLAPGEDDGRAVFVLTGCLADVPPAALLEVLAAGARVTALVDGCRSPSAAAEVVTRADEVATAIGRPDQMATATVTPAQPEHEPARSRRFRRGATTGGESPVPVLDALAMPVTRRLLVTAAGRTAEAPHTRSGDAPHDRLFAVVGELLGDDPPPPGLLSVPTGAADLAAPACGGSGVCVRVCPTDALTLRVTELGESGALGDERPVGTQPYQTPREHRPALVDEFVLAVDPARCIDCGECVRQCPEQAMQRVGPLPWLPALAGAERPVRVALSKRCSRCGASFRGSGARCSACTFRAASPFTSRLPPGFTRSQRD
ncbi:MAG: 4Fe-4S dicluster domain-containing protein [Terracoccus sp.]